MNNLNLLAAAGGGTPSITNPALGDTLQSMLAGGGGLFFFPNTPSFSNWFSACCGSHHLFLYATSWGNYMDWLWWG